MSQNVSLSERDSLHIEKIKQMFLENKSQLDMSQELKLNRRTIYRKIQKWIQTPDFRVWIKHAWLVKLTKVDNNEGFRGLTRLMGIYEVYELKQNPSEVTPNYTFRWMTDEEWKNKLLSGTVHISGKENFMKTLQDSESSVVEEGGAKQKVAQTNSSN